MEYETIKSEYVDYGRNKFLEVSVKKVLPDQTEFLNVSKGYYMPDGEKRYQRGIGFPVEEEIVNSLVDKLKIIMSSDDSSDQTVAEEPAPAADDGMPADDGITPDDSGIASDNSEELDD